jgi:tetratricopeptide (TPR) repeat protein
LRILTIVFFLSPLFAIAQPGACSGIQIGGLYTRELKSLEMNEPSVKRRDFILDGKHVVCEIYHIPPHESRYNIHYADVTADRRFLISHGPDTMMVDFVGFGSTYFCDRIDSLFILPGHFICHREQAKPRRITKDSIDRLMQQGLTPYTLGILKGGRLITHDKKIDLSFLNETALPASFLFNRAKALILDSSYDAALGDLKYAIIKNGGEKDCETRLLLCDALMGKRRYREALDELNPALGCEFSHWTRQNFYLKRIDVYTALKRYNDAMHDYDTLTDESRRQSLFYYSEKEMYLFKMRYRIKYIKDYKSIIPELEEACASGKYGYYTGQLCFELADIQFRLDQKNLAFKNWVTAFEKMGFDHRKYESYAIFDSLVKQHPKVPELYYLRAITAPAVCHGPYSSSLEGVNAALGDLDMVEKLGMKPAMFDYFKTNFLEIKRLTIASEKWKAANGR